MGTLFLVATPIGNLEDITLRALQVLKQSRLIAAEDTRQTKKLLQRYEISTPAVSYHEHNKITRLEEIITALAGGDVSLVSDAGTPALNDPGYELVRAALAAGHTVSPVPGPASPIAALIISGLPTDAFVYLGYLPRKPSERRRKLQEVAFLPYTLIFLETPHRIIEALEDLQEQLGDREMAAAREMTKIHEEVVRGPVSKVLLHFQQNEPRGEFTLVIAGFSGDDTGPWSEERLIAALQEGLQAGASPKQLSVDLAAKSGWQRRDVYSKIVSIKRGSD